MLLSTLLRLVTGSLVAAVVLLGVAQHAGGVDPWWLELSRYVPVPVLLVPAVLALLLSVRLGRAWVAASAAALLLVATLASGFEWHRPDRGSAPLRLMTYNIKAYRAAERAGGFAQIARAIAAHAPDILVLQDARMLPGIRSGLPVALAPPLFGLAHVAAYGQYVIASRYPLSRCGVGRLGRAGSDPVYLHCVASVDGVELNVVTAHFESPRDGLNAARHEGFDGVDEWRRNYRDRLAQARALADDLPLRGRPLVVAGDLNAPVSSPVLRTLLATGLRDAYSSVGRGFGYSYGHDLRPGFSFLRIDHVLVSDDLGLRDCHVGGSAASEHRPVIADLLLRRDGFSAAPAPRPAG